VHRPLPCREARQCGRRVGAALGLETRPPARATGARPLGAAPPRCSSLAPPRSALAEAHSVGPPQGSRPPHPLPAGGPRPAAPPALRPLPLLAAQGEPARPLPPPRPLPRRRASRRLAGLGLPQPHPLLRQARQHHPPEPRRHPRRCRARPLQQPSRGSQQQDPPHQPPWLWASDCHCPHRDDLPLLRRDHRGPPPPMTSLHHPPHPQKPEENQS
jgi:hypothetical protein